MALHWLNRIHLQSAFGYLQIPRCDALKNKLVRFFLDRQQPRENCPTRKFHIFHFFRGEEDRGQVGKDCEKTTFQMCASRFGSTKQGVIQNNQNQRKKEPPYKTSIPANVPHLSTAAKQRCSNFSALGPRLLKSLHREEISKLPLNTCEEYTPSPGIPLFRTDSWLL